MKEKINTKQMAVIRRLWKDLKMSIQTNENYHNLCTRNELYSEKLKDENNKLELDISEMRQEWTAERAGLLQSRQNAIMLLIVFIGTTILSFIFLAVK